MNGKEYKKKGPEYRFYKTVSKRLPMSENEYRASIKGQVLTIYRTGNSFARIYKNPITEVFPIGSEVPVYYDPDKPKLAYVLRYCNRKGMFWLPFLAGAAILVFDAVLVIFNL